METKQVRLKEVLAVVNNKGGVGKTTTVQSLAAALVRKHKDYRVLVIDLDPQIHLSLLHGWCHSDDYEVAPTIYTAMRKGVNLPVYRTTREGVFLVPGDDAMNYVDADLYRQMNAEKVLQKCFGLPLDDHTDLVCPTSEKDRPSVTTWQKCKSEGLTNILESFDYVLIDCEPSLSETTFNAMTVASGLLVPVQMKGLSVNGMGKLLVAMRKVQAELNQNLELRGLLPTMIDGRPKIVKDFMEYMNRVYGANVCRTSIRACIKMDEAQTHRQDIFQYKPYSTVGIDYDMLSNELFA